MFQIGEFSKLTLVSIRMLRYYDEMELLKPAQIQKTTGYRLYTANQIPTLNRIVFLRDIGFKIAEIRVALEQWDDYSITTHLQNKSREIVQAIQIEQHKLEKIKQAQKDIQQKQISIHYNVTIKSIPSYQVLSIRKIIPNYYAEGLLWKEMTAFATAQKVSLSTDSFTIYHDLDYRESNVDVEVCTPVLTIGKNTSGFTFRLTEPEALMACSMVYGSFNNIAAAFRSFSNWLQEHNQYRMKGQSRQIIHRGPWNEELTENYLTEIQIPLEQIN